ncbi:T6SS effector phospholipase Tle3 domain-containing protein [Burkholderia sp. MR1-5-21]
MSGTSTSPSCVVGERKAILNSNRPQDAFVNTDVQNRFPCTTILIHGVNDLGTDFGSVEGGLCEGLNDRLGRTDFKGAEYSHGRMANEPRKVNVGEMMKGMDDVIYRRQESEDTKSPLIPFYWGLRVGKEDLPKDPNQQTINGQYVDRFGNRLDEHRARNGGFFANATNNIPDMFDSHFKGGLGTKLLDWKQNDPTHPLRETESRHYMVLAARRLAALVRQIRLIDPDGTVNIIAHSQGTLISLLAQAYLVGGLDPGGCSPGPADRPADTLVLIDSPYSLSEEFMDRLLQRGDEQQTTYARGKTLANLAGHVANAKHATPALDQLKYVQGRDNFGIVGPSWDPTQATRLSGPQGNECVVFAERDNRGKVYMYFSPEDATVGLRGVNGMGSSGLPDAIDVCASPAGSRPENVNLLSKTFLQRVFTRRLREGKPVQVGTPPGQFIMREDGESSHGLPGGFTTWVKSAPISVGTERNINGEALTPPFDPEMEGNVLPGTENNALSKKNPGEHAPGKQSIDQLEAEIALSTNSGEGALQQLPAQTIAWPMAEDGKFPTAAEVEQSLNAGMEPDDQCKVGAVVPTVPPSPGQIVVYRKESLNEAKVRLMNNHQSESSYHSAVMSGRRNHRCATAFDVSLGQARAIDNPAWAKLLRTIADWRLPISDIVNAERKLGEKLDKITSDIVAANCDYYESGVFPSEGVVPKTFPVGVVSETRKERSDEKMNGTQSNTLTY